MMIKQVCSRCGGSGHYSFNQKDGTVCYGCNGFGFVMVDTEKLLKKQSKQESKRELANKKAEAHKAVVLKIREQFAQCFNFDLTTVLGCDLLNKAVYKATGHDFDWHVQQELKKEEK